MEVPEKVYEVEEVNSLSDSLFRDLKVSLKKVPRSVPKKIGRNSLCSCNSGKKYKKCCLKP